MSDTVVMGLYSQLDAAKSEIERLRGLLAYGTATSEYRRIRARAERAEAALDRITKHPSRAAEIACEALERKEG